MNFAISSHRAVVVAALAVSVLAARDLAAQASRVQLVLPPSTWRLTVSGDLLPAGDVRATTQRPAIHASSIETSRIALRVGAPVWKRGLYRTVIANEFAVERIGFTYGSDVRPAGVLQLSATRGPSTLQTVQHDLLVSQGLGAKWRLSGILQHGFFTDGSTAVTGSAYRAAGGAFLTRVYRPTFQIGGGVLAINVAPYVIPTVRILHVGARWRSDVLIPRAETWYDVGHGVEMGGVLRFLANRWWVDQQAFGQAQINRTTYSQATLGPALNIKIGAHGLAQIETGAALRRMLVDGTAPGSLPGSPIVPFANRFDAGVGGFLRVTGRATF